MKFKDFKINKLKMLIKDLMSCKEVLKKKGIHLNLNSKSSIRKALMNKALEEDKLNLTLMKSIKLKPFSKIY